MRSRIHRGRERGVLGQESVAGVDRLSAAPPRGVIALDFLPTWPLRTVLSQKQRDRVSKRLAHLTTARTAGPEPWELDASIHVLVTAREFFPRLAEEQPIRAAWFRRWIQV